MYKTREIDRKAQIFFQNNIPAAWLVREQNPDFHIDYFVELFDKSGPSGILFGVQSKGTNSPDYSNGTINKSMKTKHLIYYLDKVKQPIFIVVVDVKNNIGYYLFIQEYLINIPNKDWRNQKTKVIKVKTDNLLTNINDFQKAIINADAYMRNLWPSSIDAAIHFEKKRLESLDPRFRISISHKDGQTQYGLYPKENVDFQCSLKITKGLKKGLVNYHKRGIPFSIEAGDILNIKGSKIITEAFEKSQHGKVVIGPAKQIDSSMVLSTVNELGIETAIIYNINGFIIGGKREFNFQGQLNDSPFILEMNGRINKKRRIQSLTFTFNFESKKWEGLSILHLPFFERIYSFYKALKNKNNIKMLCEIKGMRFIEGISDDFDYETIKFIFRYINLVQKARIIAKAMNIEINLPRYNSISKDDIDNIELVYELIQKGEYRMNGSNVKLKGEIVSLESFFESIGTKDSEKYWTTPLYIEVQECNYVIFGNKIDMGPLRLTLTNPKMIVNNSSMHLEMMGTENSEFIVNKIL